MGAQLATQVMNSDSIRGAYKAVLLVLALRADDRTGALTASQSAIALDAGVSTMTVIRALNYLEVVHVVGRAQQRDTRGFRSADQIVIAPERLEFIGAPPVNTVAESLQRIADALDRN